MYFVDDMSKFNINPQTGELTPKNGEISNNIFNVFSGQTNEPTPIQPEGNVYNLAAGGNYIAQPVDGSSIVLPNIDFYTEIRFWFESNTDLTLVFPNINWQTEPEACAGYIYEYIFTYINGKWVGGFVSYEMVGDN